LSDSESVIASLKDPVALDCISKLALDATENTSTVIRPAEQLKQDCDNAQTEHEPASSSNHGDLPSPTNQDMSVVTPLVATVATHSSDYGTITVLSQSAGTVGQQSSIAASEIPLIITPNDLLSLPVITLPFVACSIANVGDMSALNESANVAKSFVTVATVSDLNSA